MGVVVLDDQCSLQCASSEIPPQIAVSAAFSIPRKQTKVRKIT